MMHEVLLIKTEADNAAMLKQACKPYVQKIDLILCTDSLPQAVRLCQQHVPALIFLDTAELSASETNSCSAQFHDLCPDAFLFLISAPAGATQTLKTCVEMTILTPIDSDALRKSIGRCIRKAEAQKLLSEMAQKLSQLRCRSSLRSSVILRSTHHHLPSAKSWMRWTSLFALGLSQQCRPISPSRKKQRCRRCSPNVAILY